MKIFSAVFHVITYMEVGSNIISTLKEFLKTMRFSPLALPLNPGTEKPVFTALFLKSPAKSLVS